jgi:hypothetical protein
LFIEATWVLDSGHAGKKRWIAAFAAMTGKGNWIPPRLFVWVHDPEVI